MTENSPWDRVKKYAKQVTEAPADPAQDNREYAAGDVTKTVARKAGLPNAEEVPHFNERESFSQEMSEAGDYIADASSNAWDQIKKTGTEFGDWIDRNPNFLVGALPTLVGALEGDFAAGAAIGGEGLIKRYDEGVKAETAQRKRDLALEKAKQKTRPVEYYDPSSGYNRIGTWSDYHNELRSPEGDIIVSRFKKPGFEMKEQIKIDAAEDKAKRMGTATDEFNKGQLARLTQVQDTDLKSIRQSEDELEVLEDGIEDIISGDKFSKKAALVKIVGDLQNGRISDQDINMMMTSSFGGRPAVQEFLERMLKNNTLTMDKGMLRQLRLGIKKKRNSIGRTYNDIYRKLKPHGITSSQARKYFGAPKYATRAVVQFVKNGKVIRKKMRLQDLHRLSKEGVEAEVLKYE